MTPSAFERAAELFEELQARPAHERSASLVGLDPQVREHLGRMLAGAERPCTALDQALPPLAATPAPPERIGRFRVLRLLGEGGMGRVYEAEQESPRRRVALKVLRSSLASAEVQRRFENEAQILGRLHHPGVATVYEAGSAKVHGESVPYLAMQLVEGDVLDRFLARERPDLRARVELLACVCDAVQHAHERGIVHRDLKPSNVMVDAEGRPIVLDFGIARISARGSGSTSLHTNPGAVLGTLPYMSPEQLGPDSARIDLRTDVYALGVLLYEVLSGRRPLDLHGRTLAEAARTIESEEPRPLGALDPRLRGDLEVIAAKALAKEREGRYATAGALGDDLRRMLRNEPIVARPVTALTQLRKFARRNRLVVAALSFALLSLAAGLCAALVFANGERNQRALAEKRTRELELELYRRGVGDVARELRLGQCARAADLLDALPVSSSGWERYYLGACLADRPLDLPPHEGRVYALRADRAGRVLASSSIDNTVRLHDASGATLATLHAGGQTRRFDLSPDGRHVFTMGWLQKTGTMTTTLWEDRTPVRTVEHHAAEMGWADCAFTPDGQSLVWGWSDGVLRVWDVPSREERLSLKVHDSDVLALAVHPSGDRVVTTGFEGDPSLKIVSLRDGAVLRALPRQPAPQVGLRFLGSGATFVTYDAREMVSLWDTESGECLAKRSVGDGIRALATSTDDGRLYVGTSGGDVLVLDGGNLQGLGVHELGAPIFSLIRLEGREDLAASLLDGRILLLDGQSGRPLSAFARRTLRAGEGPILLQVPGTSRLLAGYPQGELLLLSTLTSNYRVLRGHGSYVYAVTFVPDGSAFVSGAWDATLRVWDADTLAERARWPVPDRVTSLAALGKGLVLVGMRNGVVEAIDLGTGRALWSAALSAGWTGVELAVSPDRNSAVAIDSQGHGILLDAQGRQRAAGAWPASEAAVAWDPRGRWVAGAGRDRLCLHDPGTLEPGPVFPLEGDAESLAWSPDGRLLAAGLAEGKVVVLDVERGERVALLEVGRGKVYALAFDPDGQRLATGNQVGEVSLWHTETWERLLDLDPHAPTPPEPSYYYVHGLAFSPDGTQLVSASGDHTLRVWSARTSSPAAGRATSPPRKP